MLRRLTAVIALMAVSGCGTPSEICMAGRTVSCACSDGRVGAQTCRGDGLGYLPCTCTGGGSGGASSSTGVTGSTGALSSGSTSSSGGCADSSTCPLPASQCDVATCASNQCGTSHKPSHTPCTQTGGTVCDGQGTCVGCVDSTDCAAGVCSVSKTCVPSHCADGTKDGGETDVDCGGSCGATCANSKVCTGSTDCLSGVCKGNQCDPCVLDIDCGSGKYCETGTGVCKLQASNGTSCTSASQCASGNCVGNGATEVCCDTTCGGGCQSCLASEKGTGVDGTCGAVPSGTNPKAACSTTGSDCNTGSCDGGGSCGKKPVASPCSAMGGQVCDPLGACAACVTSAQCAAPTPVCGPMETCIATCTDGTQDGGETDVDCGGPCGATCNNTQGCAGAGDCVSGSCSSQHCAACTQNADCAPGATCAIATGVCSILLNACGDPACGGPNEPCCPASAFTQGVANACLIGYSCVAGTCVQGNTGGCGYGGQMCCSNQSGGCSCTASSPFYITGQSPCPNCGYTSQTGGSGICQYPSVAPPNGDGNGTLPCEGPLWTYINQGPQCGCCGHSGERCCGSTCDPGLGCYGGLIQICTCGQLDQVCCANSACTQGGCDTQSNTCAKTCVTSSDCSQPNAFCNAASLCTHSCTDMIQDGNETDVDCGGSCVACANAQHCLTASDCSSGYCAGNQCAPCQFDVDCSGYCDLAAGGICKPKQADGGPCTTANQCQSPYCVPGSAGASICCNLACTAGCESCFASEKGSGADGTCGSIASGTNPKGFCSTSGVDCHTGTCDGNGACGVKPDGAACSDGNPCTQSDACHAGACTGSSSACAPYVCGAQMCLTTCANDVDCASGYYCSGMQCVSQLAAGASCVRNGECQSEFCSNGACSSNPGCAADAPCAGCNFSWLGSCVNLTAISTGGNHTCALTSLGGVQCWGLNANGQLGNGSIANSPVPVPVSGLASGISAIAAGYNHTCALTSGGGVQCWGANEVGQLGNNTTTESHVPVAVIGLSSGVIAIAAGGSATCAITTGGGLKCWGAGGQLGDSSVANSSVPVAVTALSAGVSVVTVGASHTCAITPDAQCWGGNGSGQLGNGTSTSSSVPVFVYQDPGLRAISAGGSHTCGVTTGSFGASAGVLCWGGNTDYQLGTTMGPSSTPRIVSGISPANVASISCGFVDTCVLTIAGGVLCWGGNGDGELGNNSTTDSATPVSVVGLSSGVVAISASEALHTCALTSNGSVECWGYNYSGQLGNNSFTESHVPVNVLEP